jgi:hypothetical protein
MAVDLRSKQVANFVNIHLFLLRPSDGHTLFAVYLIELSVEF